MILLAIDRSTSTQSVALAIDGKVVSRVFANCDSRDASWPVKVSEFLARNEVSVTDIDQIVVGTGPGSFAGIRAALAFAHGISLGSGKAEVTGLSSTLALARVNSRTAVVGDARRGLFWTVCYDGYDAVGAFSLSELNKLALSVPEHFAVVTPDGDRIGETIAKIFGHHYKGSIVPLAENLIKVALERPDLLKRDPLPLYLQKAVK